MVRVEVAAVSGFCSFYAWCFIIVVWVGFRCCWSGCAFAFLVVARHLSFSSCNTHSNRAIGLTVCMLNIFSWYLKKHFLKMSLASFYNYFFDEVC